MVKLLFFFWGSEKSVKNLPELSVKIALCSKVIDLDKSD